MLTIGPLNDLPGIRHAFFDRTGGVSEGLYTSLNCGFGSGDEADRVAENRARALARLDLELADNDLVTVYQVHSNRVAVVDSPWPREAAPKVDAMVTRTPKLVLGILTADCAPVVLADVKAGVIGAAHAGWRGALDGVLGAVVASMIELGAAAERIVAGVGPTIGQRSYEVGPEFPQPFLAQTETNQDFFSPSVRDGHFMFDLKGYVARRLASTGVKNVQVLPCDTCAEDTRFFSYRRSCQRGEPDYGRGLSVICLEP